MHGSVWESKQRTETHGYYHAHPDAEETGDSEVESDMDQVEVAEHDDGVEEHDQVSASHEECIKEDCFSTHFTKALGSAGIHTSSLS